MKRSSCLSALLVGLSLTTASAALAAPTPPTSTDAKPVKVALAPNAVQDTTPSTGTPTAAPSDDPTAQPAQPAVSVGTSSTPVADAPATPATATPMKPKPRPFAGSAIFLQNSMSTGTVFRGQQQDYNPTVETTAFILPRYALNDAFQLRGRLLVSYEYTNSDTTTYRNEPLLSDTGLSLFYRKIPVLPLGIRPNVAFNVGLPTSKLSRARTLMFSPGVTLQLVRPFEKILGGEGMLLGSVVFTHPVYQSRNAEVVDPRAPGAFQCVGGNNCQDLLSGVMNPSNILSYTLLAEMEWGHWSPAIFYLGATQWAYSPTDARNPVDGTPVSRPAGTSPTSVRQTHYLSAWLDYNFNTWLTGEVGVWNATSAIGDSGQRANIIFNRYADTRVYLGASFQLDNLVKSLQGGDGGEGGVVRAKNKKQPMWTF